MSFLNSTTFLNLPKDEATKRFNELDLAEQAQMVLMAPWEKRQELILLSNDARSLVRSLPVEELFWTLKAVGPEDSLHILRLADFEQLQFIFDLDWWYKAELRHEKIVAWLVLLIEADISLLSAWIEWIHQRDEYLLAAILRPFIRIVKRPDDMDLQEAKDLLPPYTLDNSYYVSFKNIKLEPLFMQFLNLLFANPHIYRDVFETILEQTTPESLEKAYKWRKSRLNDWGLPDYYDSLDIYAELPGNKVRTIGYEKIGEGTDDLPLPAFVPTLYVGDFPALYGAIQELSGTSFMERIIMEWVGAANKVLMADLVDLDDPSALQNALERAAGLINLGLEIVAETEHKTPAQVLSRAVIEDLIRIANSNIKQLVTKVKKMLDKGAIPGDLWTLPDEWAEVVRGLLKDRPYYFDNETNTFKTFSLVQHLEQASRVLETVRCWAEVFSAIVPGWNEWESGFNWNAMNFGSARELNWPRALLTAFSQYLLAGNIRVAPVREKELSELKRLLFGPSDDRKDVSAHDPMPLNEDAVQKFQNELGKMLTGSGCNQGVVMETLDSMIRELWEEWQFVPDDTPIDGRFVSSLLVELGS